MSPTRRRSYTPALMRRAFAHGKVLVIAQDLANLVAPAVPDGVTIEQFSGTDWDVFAPIAGESRIRRFERRSRAGRICIAAWEHGRPVAYGWISPVVETDVEGFELELPYGACYGWDLFVEPGSRGRGIAAALTGARLCWAEADGYTAIWRLIAPHNTASLRSLEKACGDRAVIMGELRYVRLLRWFRSSFQPGAAA